MSAKDAFRNHWPSVAMVAMAAVIACAGLALFWTMPPHSIVMATGPEGGAYYELGKRYQAVLARDGVYVRLVPTAGSVENLAKLLDARSGVSVALMQGGITNASVAPGLQSLGTVFYEPYWWFRRSEIQGEDISSLRGRKISIGPEGSGTRELSLQILSRVGIDGQNSELLSLSPLEAAQKLLAGDIDVVFLVAGWDSPVVQQLFASDRIQIADYSRADALVALFPFLTKMIVPRGAIDLVKDKPPRDVNLIGLKASLIVRGDLHPAIQYLLLNAASTIHSRASIFSSANQFPAAEAVDLPLSSEAMRFYRSGLPFLHEYFPFWMAELIGKAIILLIPIVGLLYPVIYIFPRIYDWAMRSRVLRLYGELRLLEDAIARGRYADSRRLEMIAQLDRLELQVNQLKIPVTYASMLYEFRSHINLVRESLKKHAANLAE